MITPRSFDTLGSMERDWLRAKLHFKFGAIGADEHNAIGPLYIWNDDDIAPHAGFGMHPHKNVEIVTFVRTGTVSHVDSFGHQGRIEAGDIQVMSAGSGILHSERNDESTRARIFQIWLHPRTENEKPQWETRRFASEEPDMQFHAIASGFDEDIKNGALRINADARVLSMKMQLGQVITHALKSGSRAYLVSTTGHVDVNHVALHPRDGASIADETLLTLKADEDTVIVMVELPVTN